MGTLDGSENDPAITNAVHRSLKRLVYSVTRTHAMNIGDATIVTVTPWWQTALYSAFGVMVVVAVGCVVMMILTDRKIRRGNKK